VYEYLEGTVLYKKEDYFVLNVNGVGFKIFCASPMIARISSQGDQAKVYTHLVVREDVLALYGFTNHEELSMFELLLTVSGIGPKVAGLLTAGIEPSKFAVAVLSSDISLIREIKGIGKKGAERIILELKDKLKGVSFDDETKSFTGVANINEDAQNKYKEACSALTVLGYSPAESGKAVSRVYSEDKNIEDIIKLALRELM